MVFSGFVIICGIAFIFVKLPRRRMLQCLGHPMAMDLTVSILVLIIHWGTFSGLMAAAFAGMMCSVFTWAARKLFGYIERGVIVPGFIHLEVK